MLDLCIGKGKFTKGTSITLRRELDHSDHTAILFISEIIESPVCSSYEEYYPVRARNLHRLKDTNLLRCYTHRLEESLSAETDGDWLKLRRSILYAIKKSGDSSNVRFFKCPKSARVRNQLRFQSVFRAENEILPDLNARKQSYTRDQ